MTQPDPFGTAALREAVLAAWRDSPTRFTEDLNTENDLRAGGYRDRLFVELAQNAADAALAAGAPGTVRVSVVDGELRVANTGVPLDAPGVAALASLRASAKRGDTAGRFGVGFAAVLAVTDAPRIVSTTGSVAFSAERTRAESGRSGDVPVLRLVWPVDEQPPEGFDTEVRLSGVPDTILDDIRREVPDLLLALPWLARIEVDGDVWSRSGDEITGPGGVTRWHTHSDQGVTWAVPLDRPLGEDVLHAPTPTDERLSLPARLIASLPIEPNRRRVLPGADAVLARAADLYPAFVRGYADRLALVPVAGFPLSEVDSTLRELVIDRLRTVRWLPAAGTGELTGGGARVLAVDSPALVELLADVVPGLAANCGPAAVRTLAVVGARRLDVAGAVEALTGAGRPPSWWRRLYDVLLPLVESHEIDADELGGLPVPLADGRTLPGPRGALLFDAGSDLLELLAEADVAGLRLVHPDGAHPLLERLGAVRAGAAELLDSPALADAVERSVADARAGLDVLPLAGAVLRLSEVSAVDGLGALALPAHDGWRRADELVLPGAPLLDVLDPEVLGEDAPLDVLDEEFAQDWPTETLTGVGVLRTFATDPETGLRDLDLVADDAWPAALRLIAAEPETWRALPDAAGWIAREALLAGRAPREWRLADAGGLAGLFDPVPDVGLPDTLLAAAGVRAELTVEGPDDAEDLLDRLADPAREVPPGLVLRAHVALAESDVDGLEPARVRAADGTVVDAEDAVVLDAPWLLGVLPAGGVVAGGDPERLADLLNLPLAEDETDAEVVSEGAYLPWSELPAVVLAADLLDCPLPGGGPILHDELTVRVHGEERSVHWWVDDRLHAADTPDGLARAFAHAAGRWADRHLVLALLDDPSAGTLLG
ncbi:sacsin N-terminal ATP-binding-like domain-containing protein [Amycolatopsis suaedae]|uniref:Molecular chaperone Hsp90 n=1 Tax=Amycolatopsis suaedae TaxID=2510978 RepID=A0A4Q7J482_9PSEU|nr:molecular chaperone Hsp90 [Amycolatopsis suaedae]RZQ61829.1 molecular chaperone Hsp90 [Amycolatopsis suaedae]